MMPEPATRSNRQYRDNLRFCTALRRERSVIVISPSRLVTGLAIHPGIDEMCQSPTSSIHGMSAIPTKNSWNNLVGGAGGAHADCGLISRYVGKSTKTSVRFEHARE